jgi:hypothetical protein
MGGGIISPTRESRRTLRSGERSPVARLSSSRECKDSPESVAFPFPLRRLRKWTLELFRRLGRVGGLSVRENGAPWLFNESSPSNSIHRPDNINQRNLALSTPLKRVPVRDRKTRRRREARPDGCRISLRLRVYFSTTVWMSTRTCRQGDRSCYWTGTSSTSCTLPEPI